MGISHRRIGRGCAHVMRVASNKELIKILKAIETEYNGYRFRSRLEARWAVFFDILDIQYEYEKEGYDLGEEGWYLPDFWLPEQEAWFEVKGQELTDEEYLKGIRLAHLSKYSVYIFVGGIAIPGRNIFPVTAYQCHPRFVFVDSKTGKMIRRLTKCWGECPNCGKFLIDSKFLPICVCKTKMLLDSLRLKMAYAAARQARFEHGEKGIR